MVRIIKMIYKLSKDISEAYIEAKKEKEKKFLDELEVKFQEKYDVKSTKQKDWHCIDVNKNLQFRFIIHGVNGLTLQITQLDTNFQQKLEINEKKNIFNKLYEIDSKFNEGWDKAFSTYLFGDIDNLKIDDIYNFIETINNSI